MGKGDSFEPLSLPELRGKADGYPTLPKEVSLGKPRAKKGGESLQAVIIALIVAVIILILGRREVVKIKMEFNCWDCGKPVEIEIQAKNGAMAAMELDAWVECSECHEKHYREAKEYWHTMDFWRKTIKPEKFSGTSIDRIV